MRNFYHVLIAALLLGCTRPNPDYRLENGPAGTGNIDGEARPQGDGWDMGADEVTP